VAAERGEIELQHFADAGWPGDAHDGGRDEDVALADLDAEGAEGVVVDVGDDAVEQPQPARDAGAGDGVDGGRRLLLHGGRAPLQLFVCASIDRVKGAGAKKNATRGGPRMAFEWRRRESNPRPVALQ